MFRVHMYKGAINAAKRHITKFTDDMDCAICHKKHKLYKYPILNTIPYIKKYFISYCILMNWTQKQMFATIHYIDANWDTDMNNNNNNNDDDDDSHGNTDNDPNFQEEEE